MGANQSTSTKSKLNWNIIQGHKWTPELYEQGKRYLKTSLIPDSFSPKSKTNFRTRMKYYSLQNDDIVLVDHHVPRWLVKNDEPIVAYTGVLPFVYKVIPTNKIKDLLESYFNDPVNPGYSRDSLYDKVIRDGYLGITKQDVLAYIKNKDVVNKYNRTFKQPIIKSYRPLYPNQHWQVDLLVMTNNELVDANKYAYLLVIIDIFSKYVFIVPLVNKDSIKIAAAFTKIFLSGDIPKYLQHDNDKAFTGEVTQILNKFGVKNIQNPSYSPQTNGFVENKNKQIKAMINLHFMTYNTKRYIDVIDRIAFNINNTKHTVTKLTPLQVHKGIDYQFNTNSDSLINIPSVMPSNKHWPFNDDDGQIDEDFINKQNQIDIQNFSTHSKQLYDERVKQIQNVINRTADKRETSEFFKERLLPGDRVQVARIVNSNPRLQVLRLELHNDQNEPVFKFDASSRLKSVTVMSRFETKVYEKEFVVKNVIQERGTHPYYELRTNDENKYKAFQVTERSKYIGYRFYRSQLFKITEPTVFKERTEYPNLYFDYRPAHTCTIEQVANLGNLSDNKIQNSIFSQVDVREILNKIIAWMEKKKRAKKKITQIVSTPFTIEYSYQDQEFKANIVHYDTNAKKFVSEKNHRLPLVIQLYGNKWKFANEQQISTLPDP